MSVAVRYDDLGPEGHINNVASVRIIEEARRTYLGRPVTLHAARGLLEPLPTTVRHLVRKQEFEYHQELWYQATPLFVDVWVSAVGTTSFRVHSAIRTCTAADPAVTAEAVIVLVDEETRKPWPIPDEFRPRLTISEM
ncbi:acyl-CoA thioesterase [Rhodococcus sp. NPDC056516]|uniref:acyl-CoA thioesterase n=1 Tax=Rhodococcus sp. NPDC056516 TaxID=3345847 RepID=UPI003672C0BE